jgi:hypothetical protein
MYTGYMLYQAERPKSAREQREIDVTNARLAAPAGYGTPGVRRLARGQWLWRSAE